jgi:hypothetical protein
MPSLIAVCAATAAPPLPATSFNPNMNIDLKQRHYQMEFTGAFVDGGMESSSPSDQSSVDRTYQIMSGINAWKLLQKCFDFRMHGGMYCLPGKENRPGKDSAAIEGVNYFNSLDGIVSIYVHGDYQN